MNLAGRRVLVTGGAGFIGSHVVDVLLSRGSDVVVFDDMSMGRRTNLPEAPDGRLEIREGDIRNRAVVVDAIKDSSIVLHMAVSNLRVSLSAPWLSHEINAGGTLSVLEASLHVGVSRFVYCSSSEVYGTAQRVPMTEEHPLKPTTVYGASKLAGENYSRAFFRTYGLPTTVVRPFNTYGPREHMIGAGGEVIPRMILRALAGRPPLIFGDGLQTRDFMYVTETAEGIVRAVESDELVGDVVNIGRGEEVSIKSLAALICSICGSPDPVTKEARPGDVSRHWADLSKAKQVLGLSSVMAIEDGLRSYIKWIQRSNIDPHELVAAEADQNWELLRGTFDFQ